MTSDSTNSNSNSDTGNNLLTNFQPMSKRFMVWDKETKEFCKVPYEPSRNIFTLEDLVEFLSEPSNDEFIVIQSTNLFDKDGEEIFEGSAVRDFDEAIGVVYYDMEEGGYWEKCSNGDSFEIADSSCDLKVLGHILSNPKLLEDK